MRSPKNSVIFIMAACLTALSAQAPPVVHGRCRYVLNGFGPFTKLDTVSERTIFSFNLATRTGKLKIPPTSGPGAVDECLSAQAIYVPRAGALIRLWLSIINLTPAEPTIAAEASTLIGKPD